MVQEKLAGVEQQNPLEMTYEEIEQAREEARAQTLLIHYEDDLLEALGSPERVARFKELSSR